MTDHEWDGADGSELSARGSFFRKIDWAAFWTGTALSFLVYFLTAAPTVTLEDAGELAVAGDHLGVPHPPGYPIWTMCAWVFARMLSFVTFQGQPNPAWAIAIMSGFFGALAAGLAAMLVTRTSSDILRAHSPLHDDGVGTAKGGWGTRARLNETICWASGVASSLVFAFSPVMWSQATIVEVYTLNAFFLMLIFLLTYRWMCRPTNRILWWTAFVFGLGLTNYQVLLLAIIPLVIVILLQNIALFRDFVLVVIPFGLTAMLLKLGAMTSRAGFPKHELPAGSDVTCSAVVADRYYIWAVLFLVIFVVAAAYAGILSIRKARLQAAGKEFSSFPIVAVVCAVAAVLLLIVCGSVPSAPPSDAWQMVPQEAYFKWAPYGVGFAVGLIFLFGFALFTPGALWYAIAVAGIEIALAIFIHKGAMLGLTHPLSGAFAFYVVLNFVVLALAWLLLPSGRTVALTVLAAELGVGFYGYMPLSSDTNPPMNWGYPRTWEGFKHALMRGQYEQITPTTMFSPLFVKQLGAYFADMRMQFTLILAPFGFVPFAVWSARVSGRRFNATKVAVCIASLVAVLVAVDKVSHVANLDGFRIDKVLVAVLLLLAFIGAQAVVISQLVGLVRKMRNGEETSSARLVSAVMVMGVSLLIVSFALGFCNTAAETLLELKGQGDPDVIALAADHGDDLFKVIILTALFFIVWGAGTGLLTWLIATRHRGFAIEITEVAQRWQIATISCFLVMSIGLIVLANPKYDVQDNFIQKVKFISSHGIYAIWIGYGLAYSVFAFRCHRAFCMALVAGVLLTPLIPIHENYFNDHLVDTMSAADQTGHDFGWQFGNYQLRGAEAITEELDVDEEPLPNPGYPPAMTPNAIFFGGTDPGRFVPTYMIYSADVRSDVFLITQNALADNTYMDTMRNLYSDQIWMPTMEDNSTAFQRYVEDVQSGRRPNIGGLSFDSGRVQVTGALAVMEINGIITEMIFKKNKARHDFYVEESYAIQWMYPHLTPHGLILKINNDPVPYTTNTTVDDMDFWDWYGRRLLSNPRYPRDMVARKSFSKLRSAIAGTYANRRMLDEAERAFQEARMLYIYSPEANLRLIQEVLLPLRRIDESVGMLELLKRIDPNNERLPLEEVRKLQYATNRTTELMSRRARGEGLNEDELVELVDCSAVIGLHQQALNVLAQHIQQNGMSVRLTYRIGMALADNNRVGDASKVLAAHKSAANTELQEVTVENMRRIYQIHAAASNQQALRDILPVYLRLDQLDPSSEKDWRAWLDFASLSLANNEREKALGALHLAIRYGGREAENVIVQVPQLAQLIQSGQPVGVGPLAPSNRRMPMP